MTKLIFVSFSLIGYDDQEIQALSYMVVSGAMLLRVDDPLRKLC
jgi:hypothetical protein